MARPSLAIPSSLVVVIAETEAEPAAESLLPLSGAATRQQAVIVGYVGAVLTFCSAASEGSGDVCDTGHRNDGSATLHDSWPLQ